MNAITLKLEPELLQEIDEKLTINRYATRTEFIRDAIRTKLSDLEKERMLQAVEKLHGSSKRKTTDEQLHEIRERVFKEREKKFKRSRSAS